MLPIAKNNFQEAHEHSWIGTILDEDSYYLPPNNPNRQWIHHRSFQKITINKTIQFKINANFISKCSYKNILCNILTCMHMFLNIFSSLYKSFQFSWLYAYILNYNMHSFLYTFAYHLSIAHHFHKYEFSNCIIGNYVNTIYFNKLST